MDRIVTGNSHNSFRCQAFHIAQGCDPFTVKGYIHRAATLAGAHTHFISARLPSLQVLTLGEDPEPYTRVKRCDQGLRARTCTRDTVRLNIEPESWVTLTLTLTHTTKPYPNPIP